MSDLNYEQIVNEIKVDLIKADPNLAPALALESEPMVKLIEVFAYRLLDMQNRINQATKDIRNA